jgi:hypothetical protein
MKTNPQHLSVVDFEIYPSFEVGQEAVKTFQNKIQGYIWVLHQNGFLVSVRTNLKKTIKYILDFNDPMTVSCFNEIPIIFRRQASVSLLRRWKLKINEIGSENADTLRIDDGGDIYIMEYHKAWNTEQKNSDQLWREVNQVSKELSDS